VLGARTSSSAEAITYAPKVSATVTSAAARPIGRLRSTCSEFGVGPSSTMASARNGRTLRLGTSSRPASSVRWKVRARSPASRVRQRVRQRVRERVGVRLWWGREGTGRGQGGDREGTGRGQRGTARRRQGEG